MKSLQEKRVLVTGASGFVGSHLSRVLYAEGARVVGFVRERTTRKEYLIDQHVLDMSDRVRVRQLVQEVHPELVVHLAASKNRTIDQAEYRSGYDANLFGTLNLIEACRELNHLVRFMFLGSCEEYGYQPTPFDESVRESPVSVYGVTKLAVTQLLQTLARAKGFPAVILRPSIVYGPGQTAEMFLPALIQTLLKGERFAMSQGTQTRDFVYVDDLVNAIVLALNAPGIQGQVINVSSAIPIRIDDLARKAARLIAPNAEKLLDFGSRPCRPGEAMNYWAKNLRAETLLGWEPHISLEDGLLQTIAYFRATTSAG